MKIFIDIDNTIFNTVGNDYKGSTPIHDNIEKANKLYEQGHTITYWTARGCHSGTDYTELTRNQLEKWGCKYHDIQVGNKPHFDMYICDKSWNSESFFHYKLRGLP